MRRLTREEIKSGGSAMPRIMNFHDQLIGCKFQRRILQSGKSNELNAPLLFESGARLLTQYDDEGNPGAAEWQVTDREGYLYHPIQVRDLVDHRVTDVGYFHDPENDQRHVIPYVEIAGIFLICCMTPHGGGVIYHDRPREDCWDIFCQFKPNI